ncbi:MAG: hypothetical protein ACYDC3_14530 [Candidatus Binataceae bacterium]
MKWNAILAGAMLFSVSAGQAGAAIWCGQRPGTELNHPCGDSDALGERAFSKATGKFQAPWKDLKGVWNVLAATSAAEGRMEIQVLVDPPWAGCARSQIPTVVNGIPVLVVPSEVPKVIISNGYFGYLHRPPSRKSNDNLESEKTYAKLVHQYGSRWLALPGVIGIAPGKCDCRSCDFKGVEVSVQRQFMRALLKQIPPLVDGVPVTLLPSD